MKKTNIFIVVLSLLAVLLIGYSVCTCNYSISSEEYLNLYEKVIDKALDGYDFGKSKYIAVDANSFLVTSQKEQLDLMKYLQKYSSNVIVGSYSLVAGSNDFVDDTGTINGTVISSLGADYNGNVLTVTVKVEDGTVAFSKIFTCKYRFNDWSINEIKTTYDVD